MSEASRPEYFVDGFLIKYFDVWPIGIDKNNLFDEQKVFLVYLMGIIPTHEEWNHQVDYKVKANEIKHLTLNDIEISSEDLDLAGLQGRDIAKLKSERLAYEKEKRMNDLNKSFGIEKPAEKPKRVEGIPENDASRSQKRQEKLWNLLQGKGIVE